MKVYLSKPRYHWISPYKILEYMFFWTAWSKCGRSNDIIPKGNYVDYPAWVETWAERLTPVSKAIQWVLDRVHPEVNYIKIDYWDSWSMDWTLSPIILPMLIQLKKYKHGSGMIDDEDVPEHLRSTAPGARDDCKNEWDSDKYLHDRYEWMLDELIWTFTQLSNRESDKGEAQFWDHSGWDDAEKDIDKQLKGLKCDWDGLRAHQARVQNGCRLFGKYFQTLWD